MHYALFMDQYPVYTLELAKSDCNFTSVDDIITELDQKLATDPNASKIGIFDHFAHTRSIADGEIAANILAAKLLIFCFGLKLPSPQAMAPRPRSFGVCELPDRFVVTFMKAPNPAMDATMQRWAQELVE